MIPKKVFLKDEGQRKIREGLSLFSEAVKSTLGPCGRTVLLENEKIVGGFRATKDGVTVASSLHFSDPIHNLVSSALKQASMVTADLAGDGTTTSIVLTEAIINECDKVSEDKSIVEITRDIQKIKDRLLVELDCMSVPVSDDMIECVATTSTNNDVELGKIIADVFKKVDIVTVEESNSSTVTTEIVSGITIDKGYMSRFFVNDFRKNECVLENPYILLCDKEIRDLRSIKHIGQFCIENKAPLLIIGRLSESALQALSATVVNGDIKAAAIMPPATGYLKSEKMDDLSFVLGAVHYSDQTGDDMQMMEVNGLGRSGKVTITASGTVIEPLEISRERIAERLAMLKEMKSEANHLDIPNIDSRIESISGSFGVINVGAPTKIELREVKDRVDDAVCAIRAAKDGGVVVGGGKALMNAYILASEGGLCDESLSIMSKVVDYPIRQMMINAGISHEKIESTIDVLYHSEPSIGYNVKEDQLCDMFEAGIVDPVKVTKSALDTAVSVATTILNTSCVIVHEKRD